MTYQVTTGFLWKELFRVEARTPLDLRNVIRRYLGWRKSVKYSYKQIGSNSFVVENRFGIAVIEAYKIG